MHRVFLVICFSLPQSLCSRVIALFELSDRDTSYLLPLQKTVEKDMKQKRLHFKPTRQKKHITIASLTKFHETLPSLEKNHPNLIPALTGWGQKEDSFPLTPLLEGAHIEVWEPPYFKNHRFGKYPDYYNVVVAFFPYKPLESFIRDLDVFLRKIPGYWYKRRRAFIPHVTLGRIYPRKRRFSDAEVAAIKKYIRFNSYVLDLPSSILYDPVSCLFIKENNTNQICIPLKK